MANLYTANKVKRLLLALKEEYDGVMRAQQERIAALTAENRDLQAKVLELESERSYVLTAVKMAEKEGEKIRSDSKKYADTQRAGLYVLAERCQNLANELIKKYPSDGEISEYNSYVDKLATALSSDGKGEIDMDKILYPSPDLNLEDLCKELGVMENDDGE